MAFAAFQSTLPREERQGRDGLPEPDTVNFNPRSHERSDKEAEAEATQETKFQSTLPREERR